LIKQQSLRQQSVRLLSPRSATCLCGGLKFPPTQVASADPNTLDDYEEGTWTPNVDTGNTNFTLNSYKLAVYTKVGRQSSRMSWRLLLQEVGQEAEIFQLTGITVYCCKNIVDGNMP
jgi:hypothetical protein